MICKPPPPPLARLGRAGMQPTFHCSALHARATTYPVSSVQPVTRCRVAAQRVSQDCSRPSIRRRSIAHTAHALHTCVCAWGVVGVHARRSSMCHRRNGVHASLAMVRQLPAHDVQCTSRPPFSWLADSTAQTAASSSRTPATWSATAAQCRCHQRAGDARATAACNASLKIGHCHARPLSRVSSQARDRDGMLLPCSLGTLHEARHRSAPTQQPPAENDSIKMCNIARRDRGEAPMPRLDFRQMLARELSTFGEAPPPQPAIALPTPKRRRRETEGALLQERRAGQHMPGIIWAARRHASGATRTGARRRTARSSSVRHAASPLCFN